MDDFIVKLPKKQIELIEKLIENNDEIIEKTVPYIKTLVHANRAFEKFSPLIAFPFYLYREYKAHSKYRSDLVEMREASEEIILEMGLFLGYEDELVEDFRKHFYHRLNSEGYNDLAFSFSENTKILKKIDQTIESLDVVEKADLDSFGALLPDTNAINNTVIFIKNAYVQYNENRGKKIDLNFG